MKMQKGNVKLVPPDGGWGYAICFAAVTMLVPTSGLRPVFGMVYNDLWEEIGMDTTTMGLCTGATMMISSISAFLTSSVLKVLSIRQAAFVAAVLINVGSIAVPFSNSSFTFFLTQTLVQSSGFGLMFNLSYTSIREYFMTNRLLAVSVVQTTIALFVMCAPMIIKYAIDYYGHRGMLIVLACISLHQFVGVSLIQPVVWHMIKVEIQKETIVEMKSLLNTYQTNNTNGALHSTETSKDMVTTVQNKEKMNEVVQIPLKTPEKSVVRKFLSHIFDVDLIKVYVFSTPNIIFGLATFTSVFYIVMLPRVLYSKGKSRNDVAWALSCFGFGDLGMKVSFIFLNRWLKKVKSKKLLIVGVAIAGTARLGFQLTSNDVANLVFLTFIGVGRCFLTVLMPIVIADEVSIKKYPGAMGITGLTIGFLNFILGPIYGAIRDLTGSYDVVFWICIATYYAMIIVGFVDLNKKKDPNELQTNAP